MIDEFAKATGVSKERILSSSRVRDVVDARHLYWKLLRDRYGWSLQKIAESFGNKNHTSIRSGIMSADALLSIKDREVCAMWNRVKKNKKLWT